MTKIVLVDDESLAINTLQNYIRKYISNVEVVGIANSKQDAIKVINNTDFDLLILDINLGDGTGFEVLEQIDDQDFGVVFCTAYDEYALKAFKYSAINYILKPINPEEFIEIINEFVANKPKINDEQLVMAKQVIENKQTDKIIINTHTEIYFIKIDEIIRIESHKNYSELFLTKDRKLIASKSLKHYEEILPEHFFRVHQKHLVNLKNVIMLSKEYNGTLLLSDNSKIEVSRRKKDALIKKLLS